MRSFSEFAKSVCAAVGILSSVACQSLPVMGGAVVSAPPPASQEWLAKGPAGSWPDLGIRELRTSNIAELANGSFLKWKFGRDVAGRIVELQDFTVHANSRDAGLIQTKLDRSPMDPSMALPQCANLIQAERAANSTGGYDTIVLCGASPDSSPSLIMGDFRGSSDENSLTRLEIDSFTPVSFYIFPALHSPFISIVLVGQDYERRLVSSSIGWRL